ncbi:hypothetical protein HGB07_09105 [Candidatus Roizmanbacteria bacterium]|nr:hypothetical protein [Candidatus Roizmanbacteria bacterium]
MSQKILDHVLEYGKEILAAIGVALVFLIRFLTKSGILIEIVRVAMSRLFNKGEKKMDVVTGNIGNVGSYDVDLKGGCLVAKVSAKDPSGIVGGDLSVSISAKIIGNLIKAKIPGTVDDAIIDLIIASIEKL